MADPDTERVCLVVTGSRAYDDETVIRKDLERFPAGTILLHGDCHIDGKPAGADAIADRIGRELGFDVRRYAINRAVDGPWPAAGPRRSARMVADATRLKRTGSVQHVVGLAYPKEGEKNNGTRACVRILRVAGAKVEVRGRL